MRETLLTILRDEKTPVEQFRQASHQLAHLLAAEAASHVIEDPKTVKTPLGNAQGKSTNQRVVLIPILRAGMALLPSFMTHFPTAPVGFFGIRRDESTAKPALYYENIPALKPTDLVYLLDPMVATAGSALLAIDHLIKKGIAPNKIILVGVIGSTEGLQSIKSKYPYLTVIIAAEDSELNSKKFIVPGLGDFGDRYFGN
jgi:uracil phosphoribosyltransferase